MTAGSSLNSSLEPPTPVSFRGWEETLVKREALESAKPTSVAIVNFCLPRKPPTKHASKQWAPYISPPDETPQSQPFTRPSSPSAEEDICIKNEQQSEFWDETVHINRVDDPLPLKTQMLLPSYSRVTKPPKTFESSHAPQGRSPDDCKPSFYNIDSAPEDRSEQSRPIKIGHSPMLALSDEQCSANNTTKVEDGKINIETDFYSDFSNQDEYVSEDDSCVWDIIEPFGNSCVKTFDAILSSASGRKEDEQGDLISPILNWKRQALVERIMGEFWAIFNQDWAARMTQCPGGSSSTPGDSKDCDSPTGEGSLPTSQNKRQRSYDEESADESGNKKPRRRGGGP